MNRCLAALRLLPVFLATSAIGFADSRRPAEFHDRLAALESQTGGRLGVAVIEARTGARFEYRGTERFALCSTFKALLAGAVLLRVDQGAQKLADPVPYGAADLLAYAPVTRAHVHDGKMSVGELCAAAIEVSDNTAANLLLRRVGGPAGLTRFLRGIGDPVTRLDRFEPELNASTPGDERDTTTPGAVAATLARLLGPGPLSPSARQQLERWLIGCRTADTRLRAGLDPRWRIGSKTGTGENGATNEVAVIWPDPGEPLYVAVYYTGSTAPAADRDAVIAHVGRTLAAWVTAR